MTGAGPGENEDVEVRADGGRAGEDGTRARCARVRTDERGVLLSVEPAFTGILGWTEPDVLGRRLGELAHPDDLKRGLAAWTETLKQPGRPGRAVRLRYRHRDGRWVWLDVTSTNRLAHDGGVVTDMVDVSAEVALADTLCAREQVLAHLGDASSAGIFHADGDGTIRYASHRLETVTRVSGAATLGEQLAAVSEDDRPAFRTALQRAAGGAEASVDLGAGDRRWRVSLRPLRDRAGAVTGVSGSVEDVTAPASTPAAADPLTGCLTLEATLHQLDALVRRHGPAGPAGSDARGNRRQGEGRGTAVIIVGFGSLAELAEQYGTPSVDELLRLEALRVVDTVRSSDVVGRTGDAELAVLCAGVPGPTTGREIGKSILKQVAAPLVLRSGGPVTVRAGIGVSWANRAGVTAGELLRLAQAAAAESRASDPPEPIVAGGTLIPPAPVPSGSPR